MEEWAQLPDYPGYSVSSLGQVRNDTSGRIIAQSLNNTGFLKVAINDYRGIRRTLEVTRLVAHAFVHGYTEQCNTPIHLDGNRMHTFADNIAWRPLWFAVQYHKQFRDRRHHIAAPVAEIHTGRVFPNSLAAASAFGVLERDIMLSTVNGTTTYPEGLVFALVDPQ